MLFLADASFSKCRIDLFCYSEGMFFCSVNLVFVLTIVCVCVYFNYVLMLPIEYFTKLG